METTIIAEIAKITEMNKFHEPVKEVRYIYNQLQKLWEKLLFGQFRVSTPFPLLTMLRNNEQNLRQAMLWVGNIE